MSLKKIGQEPTLLGTGLGKALEAFDGTFFEEVIRILGGKKFAEPAKKEVSPEEEIGEMNDLEKTMYTIFVSYENSGNERLARWSKIALDLLEESVQNRYQEQLRAKGKVIGLNYHRGFQITGIHETETKNQAL